MADFEYTSFELMAAAGARELKDGEIVGVGLGLPVSLIFPRQAHPCPSFDHHVRAGCG